MNEITKKLISLKDDKNAEFIKKLTPSATQIILGVKVPILKELAQYYAKNDTFSAYSFLSKKHHVFEETFLHGLIIGALKLDVKETIRLLNVYLPTIDNWAICDSVAAAIVTLKNNPDECLTFINKCLSSNHSYVIRFGIVLLIFSFDKIIAKHKGKTYNNVLLINSNEYYVNMALAWLYSVALVKDYEYAVSILKRNVLPKFVQNKAIQKAQESLRIDKNKKDYLIKLKIK